MEVGARGDQLRRESKLVDRVPDGDGTDPDVQLGDQSVDVVGGDERHRVSGWVEPAVALQVVQIQTVAIGDIGLAYPSQMTRRSAALEPLRRPDGFRPSKLVSFWPFADTQRARLDRRYAVPTVAVIGRPG